MTAAAKPQRQMVRLRGRSYVAFVFVPTVPIQDWLQEIDATITRSPGFFAGRPVVIDLSSVDLSQSGISHLLASLQDRNIRVLGIEGVEEARLTPAMPPLLTGGRHCVIEPTAPKKPETKQPTSLLLDHPVRSGQTVIFPEGDITILGSVGSGAEVVAGDRFTSTARCAAAPWPASTGTRARASIVRRSKPNCLQSMGFTRLRTTSTPPCAASRRRPGCRGIPCELQH